MLDEFLSALYNTAYIAVLASHAMPVAVYVSIV